MDELVFHFISSNFADTYSKRFSAAAFYSLRLTFQNESWHCQNLLGLFLFLKIEPLVFVIYTEWEVLKTKMKIQRGEFILLSFLRQIVQLYIVSSISGDPV